MVERLGVVVGSEYGCSRAEEGGWESYYSFSLPTLGSPEKEGVETIGECDNQGAGHISMAGPHPIHLPASPPHSHQSSGEPQ